MVSDEEVEKSTAKRALYSCSCGGRSHLLLKAVAGPTPSICNVTVGGYHPIRLPIARHPTRVERDAPSANDKKKSTRISWRSQWNRCARDPMLPREDRIAIPRVSRSGSLPEGLQRTNKCGRTQDDSVHLQSQAIPMEANGRGSQKRDLLALSWSRNLQHFLR